MIKFLQNLFQTRQANADASDVVINAILQQYSNVITDATETAAVETAAGIIGRAFASATINTNAGITRRNLFDIGRSLVRNGEYVGLNFTSGLTEAQIQQIYGMYDRNEFVYDIRVNTPTEQQQGEYRGDEVVHIVYTHTDLTPYRGTAAHKIANLTSMMLFNLQSALKYELNTPQGFILPIPTRDGGSSTLDNLRNTIAQMKGRVATVESAQSLANTQGFQSQREWNTVRLGANPPETLISLLKNLREEIINLWIPIALINSNGGSSREAWRQFLFGTIAPMANIVTEEIQNKIDPMFTLQFDELRASDITGRARAFNSLVSGGMDLTQAASLSGILNEME